MMSIPASGCQREKGPGEAVEVQRMEDADISVDTTQSGHKLNS